MTEGRRERGASAVEYALLLGLFVLAVVGGLQRVQAGSEAELRSQGAGITPLRPAAVSTSSTSSSTTSPSTTSTTSTSTTTSTTTTTTSTTTTTTTAPRTYTNASPRMSLSATSTDTGTTWSMTSTLQLTSLTGFGAGRVKVTVFRPDGTELSGSPFYVDINSAGALTFSRTAIPDSLPYVTLSFEPDSATFPPDWDKGFTPVPPKYESKPQVQVLSP